MMRVLGVLVLILCIAVVFTPSAAQESGGTIVYGNPSPDETFDFSGSPIFCENTDCFKLVEAMYISLLGIDPETGWFAPNQPGALAQHWEFSNGNQVLTLHLRDDLYWSDGMPITAADVMMSYELALHPETNSDGEMGVDSINTTIENVEVLDEHTIRISFTQGSCTALADVDEWLTVPPAHIYRQLIAEVGYEGLPTHEWFQHPTVVSGPFRFGELAADNSATLLRNTNYHDNALGTVSPERFRQVPLIFTMSVETFLAGEINVTNVNMIGPEQIQAFVDAAQAGALQLYQYSQNNITFLAMNQADPHNPQPALDENGQRINQGLHPIFGDKLTRQAIARAIDVDSIIAEAQFGFATRLSTYIIPNSWAFNANIPFIPYDPQLALAMLAEAGWIPENPDLPAGAENQLICQDCRYAREVDAGFNGSYMEFEIFKNGGRVAELDVIARQLAQIGITIHIEEAAWDVVLDNFLGQTYDAFVLGFNGSYPYDPTTDFFFGPFADNPGSGFNFTSFYNEAYFALEATANSVPGCGLTERANIYRQMQEIIYEEQPFIFLYANTGMYVARNEVEGFDPYPSNLFWNVDTWVVHEDD